MATVETQRVDRIIESRRAMLVAGGAALAALAFAPKAHAQAAAIGDNDILNFALNLEYLEAQFYNLAVNGVTIDQLPTPIPVVVNGGTMGTVTLKPNFTKVPFAIPTVAAYAAETAIEEGKHVLFLQQVLSTNAVSMPNIDLYNSFNTLATAAGINGGVFDPFANDANFLIGAYIFEDVGVSAYNGAAPLISDKTNVLPAAAGILAVEAYHAGLIRTTITGVDDANGTLAGYTQKISATRALLANPPATGSTGASMVDDIGLTTTQVSLNTAVPAAPATTPTPFSASTIVDASASTSLAFSRNTSQVLAIVTGGGVLNGATTNQGLFFPNGLNGTIV